MYLLRLGLAGVGGERVGGEQIERQLAASGRPGGHAVEQLVAELRQVGRQAERRIVDGAAQPVPERVRRGRPPRVEPGQDLVAGHFLSRYVLTRFVSVCVDGTFVRSPMLPE